MFDIIKNNVITPVLSFVQGAIDGNNGSFAPGTVQIRTGFLFIGKGNTINVTLSDEYRAHLRWYSKPMISEFVSSQNSASGNIQAPADYLAITMTSPSWGDIVPSEGSHLTVKVYSVLDENYGSCKSAYMFVNGDVTLDTYTWILNIPSGVYGRIITSFGEKFNISSLGNIQLSQSCVIYYKKSNNTIVSKDYTTPIDDTDLYYLGVINGPQVININILSPFTVNGVKSVGDAPQFRFFSSYRYDASAIAILGDSISTYDGYSEGAYYPTSDVDAVGETWWGIVAKGLRVPLSVVTVSAISRTSFIDQNDSSLPPSYDDTRIARLGASYYPSYIFVNMGTNDPYMGTLGDMTYETDITALNGLPNSTTRGIALTIRKLQNSYPHSRIVLLIPKPVNIQTVHGTASQYTSELVDKIAERIKEEIQSKVNEAGIEIIEARITYLAYATEIAAVMLQRQQASAIIDARKMIVDGAVGMVEMALERLESNSSIKLDDERKAAMVSNLLVVLCGSKDAQPIVNSGSIY